MRAAVPAIVEKDRNRLILGSRRNRELVICSCGGRYYRGNFWIGLDSIHAIQLICSMNRGGAGGRHSFRGARHEASPPQILTSGSGLCRALSRIANRLKSLLDSCRERTDGITSRRINEPQQDRSAVSFKPARSLLRFRYAARESLRPQLQRL